MSKFFLRQLPLIGREGQRKLKDSFVCVVGVGGLGSVVADLLVRSGVGKIRLIDKDTVQASNLHRQLLYSYEDLGKSKAETAAQKLRKIYPEVSVEIFKEFIHAENALELLAGCDVVVDCTDRIRTRYILNDAAWLLGIPWVYGALLKYSFQVSVFNFQGGASYRCLFPEIPSEEEIPTCNSEGVLPPSVYVAASLQANEVLKTLLEDNENLLNGKLLLGDLQKNQYTIFEIPPCEKIKNEILKHRRIAVGTRKKQKEDGFVSYAELLRWQEEKKEFLLWDLRFPWEEDNCKLQGERVDLGELTTKLQAIDREKRIVFFCSQGIRSRLARRFAEQAGFREVFHSYCSEL